MLIASHTGHEEWSVSIYILHIDWFACFDVVLHQQLYNLSILIRNSPVKWRFLRLVDNSLEIELTLHFS